MAQWNYLPDLALIKILQFVPASGVPKCQQTCRRWRTLVESSITHLPKITVKRIIFESKRNDFDDNDTLKVVVLSAIATEFKNLDKFLNHPMGTNTSENKKQTITAGVC